MSQRVRNEKWNVHVKETTATATATVTIEISSFCRMHLLSEISQLKKNTDEQVMLPWLLLLGQRNRAQTTCLRSTMGNTKKNGYV